MAILQTRTGNIVIAVIPQKNQGSMVRVASVSMVASIWVASKKPKLTTAMVSLNHVVAMRVIEMLWDESLSMWRADDRSIASIVEPAVVFAVLDVEKQMTDVNGCLVQLSESSEALVQEREMLAKKWPQVGSGALGGHYCAREKKGRKRRNPESGPTAESKKGPKTKKDAAKSKGKTVKLKKPKKMALLKFEPANIQKNANGKALIQKMLNRLRKLDIDKFDQNALFTQTEAPTCKLNFPPCHGMEWSLIEENCLRFFKLQWLGMAG